MANNEGWVSVGINHDTAQFAANSVKRWWCEMGARRFPRASELLITADGGGSNSSRCRLWKVALQGLADELGLKLVHPGEAYFSGLVHLKVAGMSDGFSIRPQNVRTD